MITLDDETKAREMLAQHGGYLVKANDKFHVMNTEEYVHFTQTAKDSFTSTNNNNVNASL
jgi:hypothetical protein